MKPTPLSWRDTVPSTNQKNTPTTTMLAPMSGSTFAASRLIVRREESVPLPYMMDQEIKSVVNRSRFEEQAPANVWIMNANKNARDTIAAIMHQHATADISLLFWDISIKAARSVHKQVINVEGIEWWERLKIHTVPQVWHMGNGTHGVQKMSKEIQEENEGVMILVQVILSLNPQTIRHKEQRGEIKTTSVVFFVRGKKVAQRLVNKGVTAAAVWDQVEQRPNAGPDSLHGHSFGWGNIDSRCSHHQSMCGYGARLHQSTDHRCDIVRYSSRKGASWATCNNRARTARGIILHSA